MVLDLGANIECNENVNDFAELGSALFKSLFKNESLSCLIKYQIRKIKSTNAKISVKN